MAFSWSNWIFSMKYRGRITLLASLFCLLVYISLVKEIHYNKVSNSFSDTSFANSFIPLTSEVEKEYRKRYNLIDGESNIGETCTLDYINEHKLQQDHPCVIKLIRQMFTNPPPLRDVPYNFGNAGSKPSVKRDNEIMQILKDKKGGFFVECGALDGVQSSNTLDMEMNHNWTGLLIEASPANYKSLVTRNRKSWTFPVCLSLETYPTKVTFLDGDLGSAIGQSMFRIVETDEKGNKLFNHPYDKQNGLPKMASTEVQCFPFYSILLASNRTTIDYFSLDIEGHEMRVLQTIPWEKVNIKTMRIETLQIETPDKSIKNGSEALKEWLEGEPGYLNFKNNIPPFMDAIYMKDNININTL